jgi:hypothetical protein
MHRRENNVKIDYREIGRCGVNSIDLIQQRDQWRAVVNLVMSFRVPQNFAIFLSS